MQAPIGLPAYELRVKDLDPKHHDEPYGLFVGVAGSGQVCQFAAGSRSDMRDLRQAILKAIRSNREPLEALASALAKVARDVQAGQGAEVQLTEEVSRG